MKRICLAAAIAVLTVSSCKTDEKTIGTNNLAKNNRKAPAGAGKVWRLLESTVLPYRIVD